MKNDALSESLEDYLEAIFHIVEEKRAARSKDISRRLKVNSSSVTGALRLLDRRGLVNYAPYDIITLTKEGEEIARKVISRHEALRNFLTKVLSVDEVDANVTACRMEHAVPDSVLNRLIQFVEFLEVCPIGKKWLAGEEGFFCDPGVAPSGCKECLAQACEGLEHGV